jgi:hypothetical protein
MSKSPTVFVRLALISTVLLGVTGVLQAGVLDLTVLNPVRTGVPGESFLFQGTIANNTGLDQDQTTLFLNFANFDFVNLNIQELLSGDTFSVPDGGVTGTLDLFRVDLSSSAPAPQTYTADVFVQDLASDASDSSTVTINAVPEPETLALLPAGLCALLILRRRR